MQLIKFINCFISNNDQQYNTRKIDNIIHLYEESIRCFDSNTTLIIRVSHNLKHLRATGHVWCSYYIDPVSIGTKSNELFVKDPKIESGLIDPPQLLKTTTKNS